MKILIWLMAASLTANVLLGGLWLKNKTSRLASAASRIGVSVNESKTVRTSDHTSSAGVAAPDSGAGTSNATISWQDIQNNDLKEFVARLRAVGCPEETIRDIIFAEVNRRYAAKTRELWPEQFEPRPFWKDNRVDPAESKKNRERRREGRELQREKSALLVELLGVDSEKELRKEMGYESGDWMEQRVSFLPESKREAVLKYLESFEDKMQEFYEKTRAGWDADTRAERDRLERERLQGLAQFLTPQELREYDLRESQTATQLSQDLRGISLTREQYEAIFDIRKKYGDSIYNYGDIEGKAARDQVEQNKKNMEAEIAAALGKEKATEYERAQDYSYQQLARIAKRMDLPADAAGKVYDFKSAAEESAKQLRSNKTLTPEQQQQALQQVRTETEVIVKNVLGEKAFKSYMNQGGWWLNNLAPPQPRPNPKN